MKHTDSDERLVSRLVDGEASAGDHSTAKRGVAGPSERLAELVDEQRAVRQWFADSRRGEPAAEVPAGFADAVLARTRRLPTRSELRAELAPLGETEIASVYRVMRRIAIAAALIFTLSMAAWAGLIRAPDPQHLEASDLDRIQQIDAAIEAEARRRGR